MKNARVIISHLKSTNTYHRLNQQSALDALKRMLPKRLSESILFLYTKNNTLFLALKHPALLMEMNYNLTLIKELLKKASEFYPNLKVIENVKGFVSYKANQETVVSSSAPYYTERSSGDFPLHINDKAISTLIEAIKAIIKHE